jgi:hypothetical protein
MVKQHEDDIPTLMRAIRTAIDRPTNSPFGKTKVIVSTAGRTGHPDIGVQKCSMRFNRIVAREAHAQGFAVLEREEIEHRFLFKSEVYPNYRTTKPGLHLDSPGPQIVATSLLEMISCLRANGEARNFSINGANWSAQ